GLNAWLGRRTVWSQATTSHDGAKTAPDRRELQASCCRSRMNRARRRMRATLPKTTGRNRGRRPKLASGQRNRIWPKRASEDEGVGEREATSAPRELTRRPHAWRSTRNHGATDAEAMRS